MKTLLFLAAVGLMAASAGKAQDLPRQDRVTQYGITWTFDKEYPVGQFVTGDYYVVGPVTVVKIDPPSREIDGRTQNGSMINPSPRLGLKQGFDTNIYDRKNYDPKLNVALDVSAEKPLLVPVNSSLLSTISIPDPAPGRRPPVQKIETTAILTVLPSPVLADSFRPAYCGKDKTPRYAAGQLHWELLKTLDLPPGTTMPNLADMEREFARPWIDFCPQSAGLHRAQHPKENMPDYAAAMCVEVGEASLFLQLNLPQQQKRNLLIHLVQLGIDNYGVVQDGGEHNFPPDGGQSSARKWPIIFAGLMLGDDGMQHVKMDSGEDGQTYYGNCWTGAKVCWGDFHATDPAKDHEEKPPRQWTVGGRGRPGDPAHVGDDSDWRRENDRRCSCAAAAWAGEALAARLMDATRDWDHPAFFDYVDRWMYEDDKPLTQTIQQATGQTVQGQEGETSELIKALWMKYRPGLGPIDNWKKQQGVGK